VTPKLPTPTAKVAIIQDLKITVEEFGNM